MAFDYGTDEVAEGGGAFKNPEIGDHAARLKSIVHCGVYRENYTKGGVTEIKKPAPQIVAIFELKEEEDFEEDGITPLELHWSLPLKKGDKANATKLIKALDPKGEAAGFDDLIGRACTVNAKGSKALDDDGNPKYVNFGGIAGMSPKFAKMTDELVGGGVGHVTFDDLTKEAVLELNPILEVANILMKGDKYEGSKAEEIITEIRKETPEFAKMKAKDEKKDKAPDPKAKPEKESTLDEEEEF